MAEEEANEPAEEHMQEDGTILKTKREKSPNRMVLLMKKA